jgi:hypothetical protein
MKKQIPPRTAIAPTAIANASALLSPPDELLPGVLTTTGGVLVVVGTGAGDEGIPGANGLVAVAAVAAAGAPSISTTAASQAPRVLAI